MLKLCLNKPHRNDPSFHSEILCGSTEEKRKKSASAAPFFTKHTPVFYRHYPDAPPLSNLTL